MNTEKESNTSMPVKSSWRPTDSAPNRCPGLNIVQRHERPGQSDQECRDGASRTEKTCDQHDHDRHTQSQLGDERPQRDS